MQGSRQSFARGWVVPEGHRGTHAWSLPAFQPQLEQAGTGWPTAAPFPNGWDKDGVVAA